MDNAPVRPALTIDRGSEVPVSRQLRQQISHLVRCGALPRGDRLPPARSLAAALRVNRNTIQRVYQELEEAGLLVGRRGDGTYVAVSGHGQNAAQRRRASALIRDALQATFDMGIDVAEARAMFQHETSEIARQRRERSVEILKSRKRFAHRRRFLVK